jgi:FixJ family two-component response regulator
MTHMNVAQTIAVIDDDSSVRSAISFLLKSLGYLATTFESAEAFLESASLPQTSCVITDVKMPGMTGVELQERLISSGYRFPIIFVTAFPEEHVKARVLSAGAHCFLTKPCEPRSLINCVVSALQS